MKSTVEPLEGNKVKLSVEVDEGEFEPEVDAAFRRIAREVRLPGFRPGKAPRKLLEARLGSGVAREEAMREALPGYLAQAVREHDVDAIAPPEVDITEGQETGPVLFDAVVEVRPQITVGGYDSLRITLDRPEPTDEEVEAHIDRLREQHAELVTVDRPAREGDQVSIDIGGSQNGEPLAGLTTTDYLYEVGSGTVVPEMDAQLDRAKVGDILTFTADHPDPDEEPVDFRILVKEVKEQVLPEADDAWAAEASEFDTIAELRDDLVNRLSLVKRAQAQMARAEKAGEALAALVTDEVPEALVNQEMQQRLSDLAMRLDAQGISVEQYLQMGGRSQEDLLAELRDTASSAVRVDLALRAVAAAESIDATDDDLAAELARVDERLDEDPAVVRDRLEHAEQLSLVRSDVAKRKALDWVLERVEIVDEAGKPIDAATFEMPEEDLDDDEAADELAAEAEAEEELEAELDKSETETTMRGSKAAETARRSSGTDESQIGEAGRPGADEASRA